MKSKTLILLFITLIISCDTEDIMPALSISSDNTELSESDGVTTITASLNTVASQEITLPLTFNVPITLTPVLCVSNFLLAS